MPDNRRDSTNLGPIHASRGSKTDCPDPSKCEDEPCQPPPSPQRDHDAKAHEAIGLAKDEKKEGKEGKDKKNKKETKDAGTWTADEKGNMYEKSVRLVLIWSGLV